MFKGNKKAKTCSGQYGRRCFSNYCGVDLNACNSLDYFVSALRSARLTKHLKIYLDVINSIQPCSEATNSRDFKEQVCQLKSNCIAKNELPLRKLKLKGIIGLSLK